MKLPLFIEFNGLKVLVVGGGNVGTRRALKFLNAGAEVKVVSTAFSSELEKQAANNNRLSLRNLHVKTGEEAREFINWADIVVVATNDSRINRNILFTARSMGKLVNNATDSENTDIVVPFELNIEGLRIAVTSEGKAGVVARKAMERIKKSLEKDVELKTMMKAMSRAKKYLKENIEDPKRRIPIYFIIEEDGLFKKYCREGLEEKAWLRAKEIIDRYNLSH